MDPLGFGLEHYDAVGAYRAMDGGSPIDSSGVLPDGSAFDGAAELRQLIADDPNFATCLTNKLYTYAMGRLPVFSAEHYDGRVIETLSNQLRADQDFANLVTGIVSSIPFGNRHGQPPEAL
jgi:hypothetical protein